MKKRRSIYFAVFILLFVTEVLIALFVKDKIIRPYVGDIIIVPLIYCFVRMFFPRKPRLLPLYVFLFAVAVEVLQYFDFVTKLGLDKFTVLRIALGSTFSLGDIVCYFIGGLVIFTAEKIFSGRRNDEKVS